MAVAPFMILNVTGDASPTAGAASSFISRPFTMPGDPSPVAMAWFIPTIPPLAVCTCGWLSADDFWKRRAIPPKVAAKPTSKSHLRHMALKPRGEP